MKSPERYKNNIYSVKMCLWEIYGFLTYLWAYFWQPCYSLNNMGSKISWIVTNLQCTMQYTCMSKTFEYRQVWKEYTAPGAVRVRDILTYTTSVVSGFCYSFYSFPPPSSEECFVDYYGIMAPQRGTASSAIKKEWIMNGDYRRRWGSIKE